VIVVAGVVALGIAGALLLPVLFFAKAPGRAPASTTGPAAPRPTGPSSATAAPRAGLAKAIPLRFAGTWRGRADQPDGTVPHWSAVLKLPLGATAGTFTITSMPCFATVTVAKVTQTAVLLRETVGAGSAATCAPSGFIALDHTGRNRAVVHWQDASDQANTASGTFVRG
jgi:hypothetical protein